MQLAIFVTIALVGVLLLIVTLLLGELFEHGADLAHDVADLVTDSDSPMAEGHGGPSPFGLRVMSAFATGFGAAGAVATTFQQSALVSSGYGVLSGLGTGLIVYEFARFLYKQESGDVFEVSSVIGRSARVSLTIPTGGTGEISFIRGGERHVLIARSADGLAIPDGSDVVVEDIVGDRAVVRVPAAETEEAQSAQPAEGEGGE